MEKIEYFVELKIKAVVDFFGVRDGCWRGVGGRGKKRSAVLES